MHVVEATHHVLEVDEGATGRNVSVGSLPGVYRCLLVDCDDLNVLELEGITVDNTADTTWRRLASS